MPMGSLTPPSAPPRWPRWPPPGSGTARQLAPLSVPIPVQRRPRAWRVTVSRMAVLHVSVAFRVGGTAIGGGD